MLRRSRPGADCSLQWNSRVPTPRGRLRRKSCDSSRIWRDLLKWRLLDAAHFAFRSRSPQAEECNSCVPPARASRQALRAADPQAAADLVDDGVVPLIVALVCGEDEATASVAADALARLIRCASADAEHSLACFDAPEMGVNLGI